MTNAQSQFTSLTPAPMPAACTGAYSGGAMGTAQCGLILAATPMGALMPNTNYTGVTLGCVVACVTGACPSGMTCLNNQICIPN